MTGHGPATGVDPEAPVADILAAVARALGKQPADLTVAVLDRPRHADLVADVRGAGAAVRSLLDGDVAGAMAVGRPRSGVDVLIGIGGTPEGVIAACALRCSGGEVLGRLHPRDEGERTAALDVGLDLDRVLTTEGTSSPGTTPSSPPPASPRVRCSTASSSSRMRWSRSPCRCGRAQERCGSSRHGTTARAPT